MHRPRPRALVGYPVLTLGPHGLYSDTLVRLEGNSVFVKEGTLQSHPPPNEGSDPFIGWEGSEALNSKGPGQFL